MLNSIVAKRYARALLELGKDNNKYEQYGSELANFILLLDQSIDLELTLINPAFTFDSRKGLLKILLNRMELSNIVNNFFCLLMDKGRFSLIRNILKIYARLIDEVKGIIQAEVVTVIPLNDIDVARLKKNLKKIIGSDIFLQTKQDPGLIGGAVVYIGDLVIDGSVKSQLDGLTVFLKRGNYV